MSKEKQTVTLTANKQNKAETVMGIDQYTGRWHITEMEAWDEDSFNMDGQAYLQIDNDGGGSVKFGAVQVEIDGKASEKQRFEFSFQGFDEGDQISGWGWVTLKVVDTLEGEIRFFQGDESGFIAKKQ